MGNAAKKRINQNRCYETRTSLTAFRDAKGPPGEQLGTRNLAGERDGALELPEIRPARIMPGGP